MKRSTAAFLAALILLFAAPRAGAQDAGNGGRHPYTIPHVLRYATDSDITGLNPFFSDELVVTWLSDLTMAWFVRYDHSNKPIPELLTVIPTKANGGISPDGKTFTWHLRRDAKWSDGVPFTADDVIFSVHAVLNPANNVISRDGWDLIQSVEAPDKYTVVMHMKQPYSAFLSTFFSTGGANPCLIPKHILGSLPDINHADYNSKPIGIGPFVYKDWKRGESVELVPNDNYFRGKPKLQRIIYKLIPDRNTVLTQLQTHEIDLWITVPAAYADRVKAISGVVLAKQPSYGYNHIDFNLSKPVVADAAVRQALRLATDRKTILEKIFRGYGRLQEEPISIAHPMHSSTFPLVPFDLAKANALLDAAGWKRGTDGVRSKNGVRLTLDFVLSSGSPDADAMVEMIRPWWQSIGVDMSSVHRYLPSMLFNTYQNGGILYAGKFDATTFAWFTTATGDQENLYGCTKVPPNGQNLLHYCNKQVDAAMAKFKVTYDLDEQRKLDQTVMTAIVHDAPTFVLIGREDLFGYNSDLKGFNPNQVSAFDDFMNVDI
jgi:peptide/nickel transport system substrate-binding protein